MIWLAEMALTDWLVRGKASASMRSKSKAENAENLDELVGNIMDEQKEAVNGE